MIFFLHFYSKGLKVSPGAFSLMLSAPWLPSQFPGAGEEAFHSQAETDTGPRVTSNPGLP